MTGKCEPYVLAYEYKSYLTLSIWNEYKKKENERDTHAWQVTVAANYLYIRTYIHIYIFFSGSDRKPKRHSFIMHIYIRARVICMHVSYYALRVCMYEHLSALYLQRDNTRETTLIIFEKSNILLFKTLDCQVFKKLNPRLRVFPFFWRKIILNARTPSLRYRNK